MIIESSNDTYCISVCYVCTVNIIDDKGTRQITLFCKSYLLCYLDKDILTFCSSYTSIFAPVSHCLTEVDWSF